MKKLISICLFCLLGAAQGQTIYKTVDADGNVSYSSTQPDEMGNAQIIKAPQEPTQSEIGAAHKRQLELEESLKKSQERRKAQELDKNREMEQSKKKRQRNLDQNQTFPGLLF